MDVTDRQQTFSRRSSENLAVVEELNNAEDDDYHAAPRDEMEFIPQVTSTPRKRSTFDNSSSDSGSREGSYQPAKKVYKYANKKSDTSYRRNKRTASCRRNIHSSKKRSSSFNDSGNVSEGSARDAEAIEEVIENDRNRSEDDGIVMNDDPIDVMIAQYDELNMGGEFEENDPFDFRDFAEDNDRNDSLHTIPSTTPRVSESVDRERCSSRSNDAAAPLSEEEKILKEEDRLSDIRIAGFRDKIVSVLKEAHAPMDLDSLIVSTNSTNRKDAAASFYSVLTLMKNRLIKEPIQETPFGKITLELE
uniref:Rad21_Rec8 domain-containing protein n=1 Tax=Caenorhabditis tropicalis TaxID=1561998 RepID=A0A1I7UU82_9PELO